MTMILKNEFGRMAEDTSNAITAAAGDKVLVYDISGKVVGYVTIDDLKSTSGSGTFTTLSVTGTSTFNDDATFTDDDGVIFGTGSDIKVEWNNTDGILTSGPASGSLWAGAPSLLDPDPFKFYGLFDDFMNPATSAVSDTHAWVVTTGAGGTQLYTDAAGGIFNVVTAGTDNDHVAHSSFTESFKFVAGKKLWFEARFKLAEAATNESAIWVGLTDTLTTGGFGTDATGPLSSYDGALIWTDEASLAVDFETSNAGTQATTTNIATAVTDTFNRWGFFFDGTATTSIITPYVAVNDSNTLVAGTAQNITLSGLDEMHMVFGVKAGPAGNAETLQMDYIKCIQLR